MSGRVIDERATGERYSAVRSRLDERGPSRPSGLTSSVPPFGCPSVSTQQLRKNPRAVEATSRACLAPRTLDHN
jgi:hypothetical protein